MQHKYTRFCAEESWMPYRSGVISLVVGADRPGKTGVDGAGTLSLWISTSLSLAAVVAFWLLWTSTDGWVSFVSVLSWDYSDGQGVKSFKATVTSRPLRWRTMA